MIASLLLAAAQAMTFTADRIAADNVTQALAATGHIVATSGKITVRGDYMTRDADGTMLFHDPVCMTTCSNEVGHTHWGVSGELEYREKDYVILRNAWLEFFEIPVFWLPYMYYPLETDCGFRWMPGYTGRWGGYLLTKTSYHLLGDAEHQADTYWLRGGTRFDLRYRQGVALGEDLDWNLGDFGKGEFSFYYAWDNYAEEAYGVNGSAFGDPNRSWVWESPVDYKRYSIAFKHRVDLTERDTVRVNASVFSDSAFRDDFQRKTMMTWQGPLIGYSNSGVFWEHVENLLSFGAEASGRLNEFYEMTDRLPEVYFDVNPLPVFGLPVNYETQNRIGYLRRNPAEYGIRDPESIYAYSPGRWAEYDAFRFDTYHRLTAPFKTLDDVLSVVPRLGYHGTYWSDSGLDNLSGRGSAGEEGADFRSILEGGVTFAGRGTASINEKWSHMVEPYFDVLAQQAWFSASGRRPYIFDSIDASSAWEDQFAGRARNLPYSYYGVTPGVRNAWQAADENGKSRTVVDLDVYAALQFGASDFLGEDDAHKLAEVGDPNYGKTGCFVSPGARLRWSPSDDLSFMGRAEYDSDNNKIALADAGLRQKVVDNFSYDLTYSLRDVRWWDFSSMPYKAPDSDSDCYNFAKMHIIRVGFEHQPLDWFAWGPFVSWDLREQELDRIGSWFDYLTDCLGFRFIVEYENAYQRIDGFRHEEDWSFGFYIYLRAFGPGAGSGAFTGMSTK